MKSLGGRSPKKAISSSLFVLCVLSKHVLVLWGECRRHFSIIGVCQNTFLLLAWLLIFSTFSRCTIRWRAEVFSFIYYLIIRNMIIPPLESSWIPNEGASWLKRIESVFKVAFKWVSIDRIIQYCDSSLFVFDPSFFHKLFSCSLVSRYIKSTSFTHCFFSNSKAAIIGISRKE